MAQPVAHRRGRPRSRGDVSESPALRSSAAPPSSWGSARRAHCPAPRRASPPTCSASVGVNAPNPDAPADVQVHPSSVRRLVRRHDHGSGAAPTRRWRGQGRHGLRHRDDDSTTGVDKGATVVGEASDGTEPGRRARHAGDAGDRLDPPIRRQRQRGTATRASGTTGTTTARQRREQRQRLRRRGQRRQRAAQQAVAQPSRDTSIAPTVATIPPAMAT